LHVSFVKIGYNMSYMVALTVTFTKEMSPSPQSAKTPVQN
jgi:hypothetical protein